MTPEERLDLLCHRHSVRSYADTPLSEQVINKLRSEVSYINSHEAGLNFQLCLGDDSPFRGVGRSYGMFKGVRNYLAAVIDPTFAGGDGHTYERAGFAAENFVIKCTELGLGSCFVGGTFSKEHVSALLKVYEKIPFVVAFGLSEGKDTMLARMAMKVAHRRKMIPRDFFDGDDVSYAEACKEFPWMPDALKALSVAPSALNSRPVRLKYTKDFCPAEEKSGESPECVLQITVHTIDPAKYAVELGIAKANIAYAIGGDWDWGENGAFYAISS